MSEEDQRIAIAEACNWEQPPPLSTLCGWKDSAGIAMLSDPLNDLNAMAEAEKVGILTSNELTLEYFNQLSKFAGPNARSIQDSAKIFCATAVQRAEAFLRTIGKWKD